MKKRLLAGALVVALLLSVLGIAGCQTADTESDGNASEATSARADYLVSIEDVAASPEDYVLLDCRDAEAYAAGHLPGAINTPWQPFASVGDGAPGDADWGTLLDPADIGEKLGELGVDTSKTIVTYTDPTGWGEDGRVMWTLLSAGIDNVRMLDGGFPAWVAAGNDVNKDEPSLDPTTVEVSDELDASLNVTTEELSENLETVTIVDSRSTKEYEGAADFGEARGGHIPGAISIPYPDVFNDDGSVKSDEELAALFEDAGLTDKDATIVFYCTKGIRSAHMTLLARMLGYDKAVNYDASYYSWAGDPDLPVE